MALFEISWGGIALDTDTVQLRNWLDSDLPLEDIQPTMPPPDPAPWLKWATTIPQPPRPRLQIGQFYYPVGLQQWGEMNVLLVSKPGSSADPLVQLKTLAFASNVPQAQTLKMVSGNGIIITPMYCLPPRPLAKVGTKPALYLITLVDYRYWLQWKQTTQMLTTSSTWSAMLTSVAANAGITLTTDTISSTYGQPEPYGDLNCNSQSVAFIADAIAANLGMRIVRNIDGTFKATNATTAATQVAANVTAVGDRLSGGNALDDTTWLNAILPNNITVGFPRFILGQGYQNPKWSHVPTVLHPGDSQTYTVATNTLTGYSGVIGLGTNNYTDSALAFVNASTDVTPINDTALSTLTTQMAQDYCDWTSGKGVNARDEVYPGLAAWTPEGLHSIVWQCSWDRCYTRIQHVPWNHDGDEMRHFFPNGGFSWVNKQLNLVSDVICLGNGTLQVTKTCVTTIPGTISTAGTC